MPVDLRQLGTPIETKDGAQSKADAAESSAKDYTDSEVTDHEDSTSDVHGVGESNVESESGAQSKVDSHEDSTSGVHGVGSSDVASTADVSSIQQSADVDHNQTSNRTHDGDDLSPNSVDAGSMSVTDSFTDPGGNTYTGRIGADTRRSVNQLFVQSARQDFELGLTVLDFSDGQFEIFANDDNIEESVGLDINLGSSLDDAGVVELADGETEGYSQHVEEDFGFLPSSAWVTDDVPELPDGATVEFEIEDENGNVVRIGRGEVDSDVNLSDDIETYGVETRAVLERDTDTDPTPVLDSYSVYLEGGVPDQYLDAEIESTGET